MSNKSIALAIALATTVAMPAMAQTDTTTVPKAATAAPATVGEFMTQAQKGQYRASKFIGVNIYNGSDENVGEVNEIIVDKAGAIQAIVVGVGGFLGIGEKNVALPFNAVKWVDEARPAVAATNPPAGTAAPAGTMAAGGNTAAVPEATGTVAAPAVAPVADVHRDYPDHGMIDMSKDQLKNAPEFKYFSEAQ